MNLVDSKLSGTKKKKLIKKSTLKIRNKFQEHLRKSTKYSLTIDFIDFEIPDIVLTSSFNTLKSSIEESELGLSICGDLRDNWEFLFENGGKYVAGGLVLLGAKGCGHFGSREPGKQGLGDEGHLESVDPG